MALEIGDLGRLIAQKRDGRGIRAAAEEVGVSSATLSRVENGHMPDLGTFAKICKWLGRDPKEFLGMGSAENGESPNSAVVHFKKKKTVSQETATALGELILAAQRSMQAREKLLGG